MQSFKQGLWKACHFSMEGSIRKGYLFQGKKRYRVEPRGGASPYKHLLSTPSPGVWNVCVYQEWAWLSLGSRKGRRQGQIKKLGSNVLITFLWSAISETLNFVLEMSTLSFICFLFIFYITELVWIFKNFLIFLNCSQPVAKKGISNNPAKKTKTSFKWLFN